MSWRVRALMLPAAIVAIGALTVTPTLSSRQDVSPITKPEVDTRLERATVEVISLGCDLSVGQGTAVAIASHRLLTNRHVAERFRSLNVVGDAKPPISTARSDVKVSTAADVAAVRSYSLGAEPIAMAADDPFPGERVWVAGFPHDPGPGATLPSGLAVVAARVVDYVNGRAMAQSGHVMRVDVPVRAGMSGGPVLDQEGRLAGIVFAIQTPTNDALVIPVSVLRATLKGPLVEPAGC